MQYSELVGVYQGNGSLIGELRFVLGKLRGTAHCALCDITHGVLWEKAAFKACKATLGVPFRAVHLDEREPALAAFTEGITPCVVGRTCTGWHLLVGADELDWCAGDVAKFGALVQRKIETSAVMSDVNG